MDSVFWINAIYKLVLHSTQDWTEKGFHSFSTFLDKPSCEKLCFDVSWWIFLACFQAKVGGNSKNWCSGADKLNLSTGVSSWTMEMQYLIRTKNAMWLYEIVHIVPKNNSLQQQQNSEMYSSPCTLPGYHILSCKTESTIAYHLSLKWKNFYCVSKSVHNGAENHKWRVALNYSLNIGLARILRACKVQIHV